MAVEPPATTLQRTTFVCSPHEPKRSASRPVSPNLDCACRVPAAHLMRVRGRGQGDERKNRTRAVSSTRAGAWRPWDRQCSVQTAASACLSRVRFGELAGVGARLGVAANSAWAWCLVERHRFCSTCISRPRTVCWRGWCTHTKCAQHKATGLLTPPLCGLGLPRRNSTMPFAEPETRSV